MLNDADVALDHDLPDPETVQILDRSLSAAIRLERVLGAKPSDPARSAAIELAWIDSTAAILRHYLDTGRCADPDSRRRAGVQLLRLRARAEAIKAEAAQ